MTLHQQPFPRDYGYAFRKGEELIYRAQADRRILSRPRGAVIERPDGEPVLTLQKEDRLRTMVGRLLPVRSPYVLRSGGTVRGNLGGRFHWGQPTARGQWEGRELGVYGHTGNLYTLWLDGVQVGEFHRAAKSVNAADQYTLRFDGDLDLALVAAAALFVDLEWHTADKPVQVGVAWETRVTFDSVRPTPNWVPKEERAERP